MAVKIRLKRVGKTKAPSYRVVIADARAPRDGRIIENIGWYNPLVEPSAIKIDEEKALYWLKVGAQPTESVTLLLKRTGVMERFEQTKSSSTAAQTE
ncbi:MAG TPA: 30S ribosomal protein S16 [Ktedonobacteraceae bacterium]|nr:30S ribosomal protein S16 [Ktedonobacteraceae bacterium]